MKSIIALYGSLLVCVVGFVGGGCGAAPAAGPRVETPPPAASATPHGHKHVWIEGPLPTEDFTHPPKVPHDPADYVFTLDQLQHIYRTPGEYGHKLVGAEYGFEGLSFILTETHPGGGPVLHMHDAEEAHVLMNGTASYVIGEKRFTVKGPYIAKVPAGVAHTFINAGDEPFNLVAVFATKKVTSKRVGPNPLVRANPAH